LLEPDRATRQLYARELGKRWRVVTVERAADVLDRLTAETFDAVILEFGAAGGEQWQLLAQVRRQAHDAALPIIICSAIDERGKGYELGVSAYLVKPVSPHQLSGEVARWLDGQVRAEESN
jgi:DNA-binding response OmpR family regulator